MKNKDADSKSNPHPASLFSRALTFYNFFPSPSYGSAPNCQPKSNPTAPPPPPPAPKPACKTNTNPEPAPTPIRNSYPEPTQNSWPSPVNQPVPISTRNNDPTPTWNNGPTFAWKIEPTPSWNNGPTPTSNKDSNPSCNKNGPSPTSNKGPTPTWNYGPTPTRNSEPTPTWKIEPTPTWNNIPTPTSNSGPTTFWKIEPTPTWNKDSSPSCNKNGPTPTSKNEPTPTWKYEPTPTWNSGPTPAWKIEPTPTSNNGPTHISNKGPSPTCIKNGPTPNLRPNTAPKTEPTNGPVQKDQPVATPIPPPITPPVRAPISAPVVTASPVQQTRTKPTNTPNNPPTVVPTEKPTASPISLPTPSPTSLPTSTPTSTPTSAPISAPTSTPVSAPTARPTSAPTSSPISAQTSSPISAPTSLPSLVPVPNPFAPPVRAPLSQPTASPVQYGSPVVGETPNSQGPVSMPNPSPAQCPIPQFATNWTRYKELPITVAESQGGLIGKDMVLVSGFSTTWNYTSPKVFAYDTTVRGAQWRPMDDIPVPEGLTHTGHVVVNGTLLYLCGGYVGNYSFYHPVATSNCYVYNHTASAGSQWQSIPSLPDSRAGGSLLYIKTKNSLVFTSGANRPDVKDYSTTIDHNDVWELSLDNLKSGWKTKTSIPYSANHVGYTSVTYQGTQRHYVVGGQDRTDEPYGNKDNLYEYDSGSDTWKALTPMPFPRGHFSSSTVADNNGCGFFIVAGAVNGKKSTADVHYYSIGENKWYKIGELPVARNTPVCVVSADNYLYCQGGNVAFALSWRVKLA